MKYYFFLKLFTYSLVVLALTSTGCKKDNSSPTVIEQNNPLDSSHDVNHVLSASQFSLFYSAWKKINFNRYVIFQNNVTVFAPSDSAFTAAGITQAYIDTANVRNLYKLISYHVIKGTLQLNNLQLSFQNLPERTFRIDSTLIVGTGFNLYQQYIYVDAKSTLILNGKNVNKGEQPIVASNGLIYPINQIMIAPTNTVYDILRSKPELSLYFYALQLSDQRSYYQNYNGMVDSSLLKALAILVNGYGINTPQDFQGGLTVFAPTNAAFAAAGWGTKTLVRQNFNKFAQVLIHHVIYNSNVVGNYDFANFQHRLAFFYNDFTEGGINVLNDFSVYNSVFDPRIGDFGGSYFLYYTNVGPQVGIKWRYSTSGFLSGPAYLDPINRDFLGKNGVVQEVNKLFYPQ